jgi:hypothetical protein
MLFMHAALALRDRFRIGSWWRRYNERGRRRLQGRRNDKHRPALGLGFVVTAHMSIVVNLLSIVFEARGKSHGVLPLVGGHAYYHRRTERAIQKSVIACDNSVGNFSAPALAVWRGF